MNKQKILRVAFFPVMCIALSCGNMFKPSTNLGEQIVNDVDPDLTDINRNIKPFSDSVMCLPSSMRDVNDTFPPGYQWNPAFVVAGSFPGLVSGSGEDVVTYLEFRPVNLRNDGTIRNNLKTGTIDSVVLQLRRFRIDTRSTPDISSPAHIDVDTCPVLQGFSSLLARTTDSTPFYPAIFSQTKIMGILSVSLDSMALDTVLTLKLDSGMYVTKIVNAVKDTTGPSDTGAFALCLAPDIGSVGLGRFMNINGDASSPKVVIYYHGGVSNTKGDSLALWRDHATYTAIESDSSAACASPVSSWETVRRAVYKIDVSSLANFMDTAAPDNKKYVVIQKADVSIPVSQSMSDMRLDSLLVYYKLFDTLATNFNNFSGYGRFFIRDTIGSDSSRSDTTYVLSLASMLQPLVVNHKSKFVYLFLWTPTQNSPTGYGPPFIQVAWRPDVKIKLSAIVTNPR